MNKGRLVKYVFLLTFSLSKNPRPKYQHQFQIIKPDPHFPKWITFSRGINKPYRDGEFFTRSVYNIFKTKYLTNRN